MCPDINNELSAHQLSKKNTERITVEAGLGSVSVCVYQVQGSGFDK